MILIIHSMIVFTLLLFNKTIPAENHVGMVP
jgi:hypothetical protein